jgi:hypothetical protein
MIFQTNTVVTQSGDNAKKVIFLINSGKIKGSDVLYSNLIQIYFQSMIINKTNLENLAVMFEMLIATQAKVKGDANTDFRIGINKDSSLTERDYELINLTKLPALTSVFGGLMSEDINEAVISGILKTKNGEADVKSSLEDIIKY